MASAPTAGRKRIKLECDADPGCKVFVAGTFNNWNPTRKPMKPAGDDGRYKAVLMLPPGEHEYKFVVNGDWRIDGSNPQWTPNDVGSLNSVINIG